MVLATMGRKRDLQIRLSKILGEWLFEMHPLDCHVFVLVRFKLKFNQKIFTIIPMNHCLCCAGSQAAVNRLTLQFAQQQNQNDQLSNRIENLEDSSNLKDIYIREQQAQISELQAQNCELQNRITELDREVAKMKGSIEASMPSVKAEIERSKDEHKN